MKNSAQNCYSFQINDTAIKTSHKENDLRDND